MGDIVSMNDGEYDIEHVVQNSQKSKMEIMDCIINNRLIYKKEGMNYYFAPEQFNDDGEIIEAFPKILEALQMIGVNDMNSIYRNFSVNDPDLANYNLLTYVVRNYSNDEDIVSGVVHFYKNKYLWVQLVFLI